MCKKEMEQPLLALRETLQQIAGEADQVRKEYESIFHESTIGHLPLYETEFASPHVFAKTQTMADVAGFYRAFGLRTARNAGERPDLASMELEFMHLLTLMEANALVESEEEKAKICSDAERRFLEAHIGRWLPAFAKLVPELATTRFYRCVGKLLAAFLEDEIERLDVKSQHVTIKRQFPRLREDNPVCGLEA